MVAVHLQLEEEEEEEVVVVAITAQRILRKEIRNHSFLELECLPKL